MAKSVVQRVLDRWDLLRSGKEAYARKRGVTIGEGCRILSDVVTTEPWLITIGDRVTISSDVRLITHDGSGWLVSDERGRRYRYAPISIGSEVFIGAGVTILPGVRIGDRVVVGAGSVVTRDIPSDTVAAGVPARPIGSFDQFVAKVRDWPTESDKKGSSYRDRVDSIVAP
ncbi:acyltransferase [Microbacterium proteolyticum]|jgi:acetyltransferase-like isoleucine patch superfamily enzyme|uniref:acyltransferase n=1 Tax=Microbacterium proteolyticum TaxID=1572644 RepID=UPI002417D522|nr:acyltransferase [Microbacterium proteolyticum]